ncbi:MAG: hypothetical protein KDD62_16260, partial [Bdellovibrionales bacterium]|nr:hypothetical protein [Bdellovibrionales bacterium]
MYNNALRTSTFLLFFSSIISLAACGGGGSSDSTSRFYGGIWSGSVTEVSGNCGDARVLLSGDFTHTINQNEENVTLDDSTGIHYAGSTQGDNAFSVNAAVSEQFGAATCDTSQEITYELVGPSSNGNANVTVLTTMVCEDGFTCNSESQGTANRADSSDTGSDNDSVTDETNQDSEDFKTCSDTKETTYSGDGGCGFLSTKFSLRTVDGQDRIILEPLGDNGVT